MAASHFTGEVIVQWQISVNLHEVQNFVSLPLSFNTSNARNRDRTKNQSFVFSVRGL